MTDILISYNHQLMAFDLELTEEESIKDLKGDKGLLTLIIVSLFTDARARKDDPLPDERVGVPSDYRGYWGDALENSEKAFSLGSRLWLLSREKEMPQVVARAQEYAKEALTWLVTEGYVTQLKVEASRVGQAYLGISVEAIPKGFEEIGSKEWNFTYDYINARPVVVGNFWR